MGHGKAALGCGDPMGDNMRGFTEDTLVEQPSFALFSDEEIHHLPPHVRPAATQAHLW
jgi:hypothetical protein